MDSAIILLLLTPNVPSISTFLILFGNWPSLPDASLLGGHPEEHWIRALVPQLATPPITWTPSPRCLTLQGRPSLIRGDPLTPEILTPHYNCPFALLGDDLLTPPGLWFPMPCPFTWTPLSMFLTLTSYTRLPPDNLYQNSSRCGCPCNYSWPLTLHARLCFYIGALLILFGLWYLVSGCPHIRISFSPFLALNTSCWSTCLQEQPAWDPEAHPRCPSSMYAYLALLHLMLPRASVLNFGGREGRDEKKGKELKEEQVPSFIHNFSFVCLATRDVTFNHEICYRLLWNMFIIGNYICSLIT